VSFATPRNVRKSRGSHHGPLHEKSNTGAVYRNPKRERGRMHGTPCKRNLSLTLRVTMLHVFRNRPYSIRQFKMHTYHRSLVCWTLFAFLLATSVGFQARVLAGPEEGAVDRILRDWTTRASRIQSLTIVAEGDGMFVQGHFNSVRSLSPTLPEGEDFPAQDHSYPVSSGTESPESCPELIRIPGRNDLLLVYNAAKYDPTWASHFGKRTPLSFRISTDDGKTWSAPRHIETDSGRAFTNPGAYFTSNGTLVLNYWTCEYSPQGYMAGPIDLKMALIDAAWLYGK